MPFWCLRHGETDWNARGLSQGQIEVPLNAVGLAQARDAAALLRGRGIASIVSSPLGRARVTAETVGEALGLPVAIEDGLREANFGVEEGQPMAEWLDDWIGEKSTPESAESFADLRVRAVAALDRALEHEGPVLVVAHGALFRALRTAMGLAPARPGNAVPMFCRPGTPWSVEALG